MTKRTTTHVGTWGRFFFVITKSFARLRLQLLDLLGMRTMLGQSEVNICNRDGIILVIGQSSVEKGKLVAVAKDFGFSKDRFEFHLEYEDVKAFDFSKTQWSMKYACISVGPMPHSGKAKGDCGSIIAALKRTDGYPSIIEMGETELNISKTSFRNSLTLIRDELKIAAYFKVIISK